MTTAERVPGAPAPALLPPVPTALVPGTVRPLREATLHTHDVRLAVPTYDRGALTPAVVHLSVGGFSRAHQLIYFDEMAERRISSEWGVVGVGLRQRHLQEALAPQDHLYTVIERSPDGERARVVGVMVDYHFAPEDPARVLDLLTDERTRMVSLTITGSGYRLSRSSTGPGPPGRSGSRPSLRRRGRARRRGCARRPCRGGPEGPATLSWCGCAGRRRPRPSRC